MSSDHMSPAGATLSAATRRRLRRGGLSGVAALVAALLTAAPALSLTVAEALTPERVRQLDPAKQRGAGLTVQPQWYAGSTVTGSVPGRPGNQHEGQLSVMNAYPSGYEASISFSDADCTPDGSCDYLQSGYGTVQLPAGTSLSPGQAAHIVLHLDDDTPGLNIYRTPGVPVTPFEVDVTITPTPAVTPAPPTFANAQFITHEWTTEAEKYLALAPFQDAQVSTASGTLYNLVLDASSFADVAVTTYLQADKPGLPLVTKAKRSAALPDVKHDNFSDQDGIYARRSGFLDDATLRTSTGRLLPGNRHTFSATLSLRGTSTQLSTSLSSFTCPRGASNLDGCTAEAGVTLSPVGEPTTRVRKDGRVTVGATYGVAPQALATDRPQAWGTLRLSYDASPGALGAPARQLLYYPQGIFSSIPILADRSYLSYSSAPGQPASPPDSTVTLGSAALRPAVVGDTSYLTSDELSYSTEVSAAG